MERPRANRPKLRDGRAASGGWRGVAQDLHELLQRAPVTGPYVMVGHSIGGEYVRVFTARFPSEVAGVVFVDSTHPEQREPALMLSPISRLPKFARQIL